MINLCSKSNRDDMPEIAERLLSAINDWYSRGDLDVGPNTVTYNSVINCWSKSRNRQDGEAPKRCLELLLTMISKYQDDPQTNRDARPDLITYNTIMNINAQQGDIKGATTVFNMMKKDYQSGKNNNAKPNIASYTILINAWSKSNTRDAPIEAESLLLEMIDLYSRGILNDSPDKIAYSSVINCWSKSGRIEGPKRAYDILKTMIIKYEDSVSTSTTEDEGRINNSNNNNNNNVRPDTITFSSVMNVYAKRGDIEGCNKVFDMMKKDYRRGNINAKSDVTTCNILIDAWSKSGNDKAPEEAGKLSNFYS
jgi:pentatricopeptide repeat protein